MTRILALFAGLMALAACTEPQLEGPLADLGEFHLGHNIVVSTDLQTGPITRKATKEEWIEQLTAALDNRFRRYDGDQLYHFGISVDGYLLAPPGVPLVYNPKSALFLSVTVWDDAAAKKLNPKPEHMVVFETTTGESLIIGSGHGRTREEQMQGLVQNAVVMIEEWMVKQHRAEGWFDKRPEAAPAEDENQE